jgi:glycosidase
VLSYNAAMPALPLCRIALALSLPLTNACGAAPTPQAPPAPAAPAPLPQAAAAPADEPAAGPPPGWADGAVFYEVFVRSFADSDGDGIGDFRGLTSRLNYLNDGDPETAGDLGVEALWLMPVFESPSYHGDDVADDRATIDREYGTDADFERFLAEAHRRGLRVIVDMVANPNDPAVREEMKTVAAYWLGRGLDGFRLDDTPNFNFPLAAAILAGVKSGDSGGIAAKLRERAGSSPAGTLDALFLTNHGMTRAATELEGDPARLKSAAAVLLTLPGAPFLYYGEEVGLQNGAGSADEFKRTPMPWDPTPGGGFTTGKPWVDFAPGRAKANVAVQAGDPESLFTHYRRWIRLRQGSAALRHGGLRLLSAPSGGPVLAYLREHGAERALVLHNLGREAAEAGPFPVQSPEPLLVHPEARLAGGGPEGWTVRLPAGASAVWRVR